MVKELTNRQEKILNALVEEYVRIAEPVSSKLLAKKREFNICPATIRNEFQALTEMGYIQQPHTSAGRVPTNKAYRYFVDKSFESKDELFFNLIFKEVKITRQQIENELKLAEDLMKSLEEISSTLTFTRLPEKDNLFEILTKIGPSRTIYEKNIDLMKSLLKSLENF